ncbi:MAG TPA: hypothetical protein VGM17_00895 [Rhizomicrobium sp.]
MAAAHIWVVAAGAVMRMEEAGIRPVSICTEDISAAMVALRISPVIMLRVMWRTTPPDTSRGIPRGMSRTTPSATPCGTNTAPSIMRFVIQ